MHPSRFRFASLVLRLSAAAFVVGVVLLTGSRSSLGGAIYSFGPGTLWHHDFCYRDEVCRTGDFDGDGKDDVATFLRANDGDVFVAVSDGDSFVPDPGAGLWHEDLCYFAEFL